MTAKTRADGGPDDKFSLAPLTQRGAAEYSRTAAANNEPTEAERIAQVGATKAACVDAAGCVRDVAGLRA